MTILSLCLLLLSSILAQAHMIELPPSSKECFFEDLNPSDQMTLTYQVGGGGHLDVDVYLEDPQNVRLFEHKRRDTGTYSFTAQHTGRYTYCFSNEFSHISDKTLSFNVHGIIYVPDEGDMLPIERQIRDLAAGLQAVKDEQEYLVIRERVHRNTAESTNSRVKYWSIIQAFMLLGVCAVQVVFVKRHFEVRRAI
ncbi:supernatant protein factor, C-terminal domain-containing protein [Microstroma glucosiphilum]|uniref:Supernatant protein factor, C-terminal domain-containing protein n=1 Tax=Pseudomicrostroma glucosiphilum TaxID=1684307 RepID=A0A316U3L3_9BASI|nr:supernatant protein factor, C-terminal domain-containing protein [Pseudomicrostroma glucosiphilum]PWN18953.1 supernatant protein factor, C-terminal domain-containing protein [Pseudomicrostroma glucosiphilum]